MADNILEDLAESIEDRNRYTCIVQKIIERMDNKFNTVGEFRLCLDGFSSIAEVFHLPHAKHVPHCDVPVRETVIDCMFTPVIGKSEAVIIHQYKAQSNSNNIDEQLDDTLWEICAKRFLRKVVDLYRLCADNKHWKKVIIRAVLFFKYELNASWSITIREYVYNLVQAQQLDDAFSEEDGSILDDYDKLFGETESQVKQAAREHFLKEKNFAPLDLLLKSFSGIL